MRRRSREINIFNMSLLDILCGALGAFCFMMLVLMPYYKPPQEADEVRKKQQEMQENLKKLEEMKDHLADANAARDLEELVKKLQAQIQELQGQLNQALAENERMKQLLAQAQMERDQAVAERNEAVAKLQQAVAERNQAVVERDKALAELQPLRQENQQLRARVQQLQQQNNLLTEQNDQLKRRNEALEEENRRMRQRQPFIIKAVSSDPRQEIGLYVLDPAIYKNKDGKESSAQPPFNPAAPHQPTVFPGDMQTWVGDRGVTWWTIRDIPPNSHMKLYVNLANPPDKRGVTTVRVSTVQSNAAPQNFPEVPLAPARDWIYVGEIYGNPGEALGLKEATDAERNQEWNSVGSVPVSTGPLARPGSGGPHGTPAPEVDRSASRDKEQDHHTRTLPGQRDDATIVAAINGIKARIAQIKANPATDRVGAEKQQSEIANLEERIKVLEASRQLPQDKKFP